MESTCELCRQDGGTLVYRDAELRVVLVAEPNYPGFCRVIWNAHQREMTDLTAQQRQRLMAAVWQVEAALREAMQPDKINLACLGNMTPHLHWHVIPRFADDAHFPDAVWAASRRASQPAGLAQRAARLPELQQTILRFLAHGI
jgi:diadenosine tetraphosphate (Ap4A) HIT family hydrolase